MPGEMRFSYPMMVDLAGRRIVIVGGGGVAVRKAGGLIEAGATEVVCVAPGISDRMPGEVRRIVGAYDERHLDGASMAFAATDDKSVNDRVVADATTRGVWVCRADVDGEMGGDFITPAKHRDGAIVVAVSAGSASLAVKIRDELAGRMDRRWAKLADALAELRPRIVAMEGSTAAGRREIHRRLAGEEALAVVDEGGVEGLSQWIGRIWPEWNDAD